MFLAIAILALYVLGAAFTYGLCMSEKQFDTEEKKNEKKDGAIAAAILWPALLVFGLLIGIGSLLAYPAYFLGKKVGTLFSPKEKKEQTSTDSSSL